jgi:transcriptional regulator with XRE-family HTH domain
MGRASRPKPAHLAEKLSQIRAAFGLSQNELISRLRLTEEIIRVDISAYERGVREPPLPILLRYAQLAGVYVDALIDDTVQLPKTLPVPAKYEWARRRVRHP